MVSRAATSCSAMQAAIENVTAHIRSSWYSEPAATAVVTEPGPINAADMIDQIITLLQVLLMCMTGRREDLDYVVKLFLDFLELLLHHHHMLLNGSITGLGSNGVDFAPNFL